MRAQQLQVSMQRIPGVSPAMKRRVGSYKPIRIDEYDASRNMEAVMLHIYAVLGWCELTILETTTHMQGTNPRKNPITPSSFMITPTAFVKLEYFREPPETRNSFYIRPQQSTKRLTQGILWPMALCEVKYLCL